MTPGDRIYTRREQEKNRRESKRCSSGCPSSYLKSLAELSRVPIVVTNQVRGQKADESVHYIFEGCRRSPLLDSESINSHLVAGLGIQWAHAVTIRLILDCCSGTRFIKVAKSPVSPPLAFPFLIDASGIVLLRDDGIVIMGPAIGVIRFEGHSILESKRILHHDNADY